MKPLETLLKKPEVLRDDQGRFERHGKSLSKTAKKGEIKIGEEITVVQKPNRGRGRPKGSKNKTTLQLREAILKALDDVGGAKYLATLAVENSSAFASLLGKVLPTTLTADESDGGDKQIIFRRIIVHAGDVTPPKQIAVPASPTLPRDDEIVVAPKEIKDL